MHRSLGFLLAVSCLLGSASAAFAHAHLKTAKPAVNGTVTTAPAEVVINFTEGIEPRFSSIEVRDAQDQRVDSGDAHAAPDDASRFIVGLKALPAGIYKVIWHATAVDTHKTDGTYQFTVRP